MFLRILSLWRRLPWCHQVAQDLDEELGSYYDEIVARHIESGVDPAEARRKALLRLGRPERVTERVRAEHVAGALPTFARDLRFAARTLARHPRFVRIAILTLVLGIAGVTLVFSIVDSLLIRPLPYQNSDRVFVLHMGLDHLFQHGDLSPAAVLAFKQGSRAFSRTAGFIDADFELTADGDPFHVTGERVSASMFPLLGVKPLLGRTFTSREDEDSAPVAVVSAGLWRERFQGETNIIGKVIDLDRRPYTIIGVMPARFETPAGQGAVSPRDLWVPLSLTPDEKNEWADNFSFGEVGRLLDGVSVAQAKDDAQRVLAGIQSHVPDADLTVDLTSLKLETTGSARPLLLIMLTAVGLLLAIACANLANLMALRTHSRRQEFGVRLALGAGKGAVLRHIIAESLILSCAGGGIGFSISLILTATAGSWLTAILPHLPTAMPIRAGWPTAVLALVLIFTTALICGVAPALATLRTDLLQSLREGGRGTGYSRHTRRLREGLVITEAALAMLVLVSAGLLLRSFQKLRDVNPGFQADRLMTASVALPRQAYSTQQKVGEFLDRLELRLRAMPGIQSVGFATDLPVIGKNQSRLFSAQDHAANPGQQAALVSNYLVSGDYFRTMRIPLIRGRYFTAADSRPGAPLVAIVSSSFAARNFPGRDPIGMGIKAGPDYSSSMPAIRIVGIVSDVTDNPLDQPQDAGTYEPLSQAAADLGSYSAIVGVIGRVRIVVRADGDPDLIAHSIEQAVHAIDPLLAITDLVSMDTLMDQTQATRRISTGTFALFAGLALALSLLGIYGVLAHAVAERSREIAIRMALGATRESVVQAMLKRAFSLALWGIAMGLAASLILTRFLTLLLFGVPPLDPIAISGSAFLLLVSAIVAGWLPASRAATVDPVTLLRSE